MDFEDSFFDESDSDLAIASDDTICGRYEAKFYQARICEQKWFMEPRECPKSSGSPPVKGSMHDMEFMSMKHRADLLYFQLKYRDAANLYGRLLELVPPENSTVVRQLRDSLARSLLKVGEGEPARREAEQLVLSSRSNDCCAWRLLAQCHEQLNNIEAQAMALQNGASLQRSCSSLWTSLSSTYKNLKSVLMSRPMASCHHSSTGGGADVTGGGHDWGEGERSVSPMQTILSRTVQLFRPYFSWRVNIAQNHVSSPENVVNVDSESQQQQLQHPMPSTFRAGNHSEELSCDAATISSSPTCTKPCPFHGSLSGSHISGSEYISLVLCSRCDEAEDCSHLLLPSHALLPPRLQFCFDHSLFVVLVRGLMSPEDVEVVMQQLLVQSPSSLASLELLLSTFSAMSECSCLLWARQLLVYAVRCSHSFPKQSLQSQLQEVEVQLEACPPSIREYLLSHLSKRSVLDVAD